MEEKARKFWSLFPQQSFVDMFNIGGHLDTLLDLLTEEEIDVLIERNVIFTRTTRPASTLNIPALNVQGELNIVNFDHFSFRELLPEENVAIILHEIGHLLNANLKGINAEYAADEFAASKGYAKWIARGFRKGIDNEWMGFEKESCKLRTAKLKPHIEKEIEGEEEKEE